MRIGVIGLGVIGNAILKGLETQGHTMKGFDIKYPETSINDILDTDLTFICVPTNALPDGTCDISIVDLVTSQLLDNNYQGEVVIKSTVIPGTTKMLSEKYNRDLHFCPEFLRERCALEDFTKNHDLCVIGTNQPEAFNLIKEAHGSLPQQIVQVTPTEAELTKYFSNVYNALHIVFANGFYEVCKKLGVDYMKVKNAVAKRNNIHDVYLDCHEEMRGYGGMCLPKDTLAFAKLVKDLQLDLEIFKIIVEENKKFKTTVPPGMRG